MVTAIIVGDKGQDGFYLTKLLGQKGYSIIGVDRGSITPETVWNSTITFDICNPDHVNSLIRSSLPDEIYHLAAFHQSAQENYDENLETLTRSIDVHNISLFNFLNAVVKFSPATKIFFAASSHIFGVPPTEIQSEVTPINPCNLYGITKAAGMFLCRKFRAEHHIFASCGILYNHESPRRNENFLSKKISTGVIQALQHRDEKLTIGNLNAVADWGYAPDYVDAFHRILHYSEPDDFVVATGIKHSVKDFVDLAFQSAGLDWTDHVIERKGIIKRETKPYIGDSAKLVKLTGWKTTVTFEQMVKILVLEELRNESWQ